MAYNANDWNLSDIRPDMGDDDGRPDWRDDGPTLADCVEDTPRPILPGNAYAPIPTADDDIPF